MKPVFLLSILLICACRAAAQSTQPADTLVVNMLNFTSAGSGAANFEFNRDVQRFFNRNLRAPFRGRELVEGYATVSFVVDSNGKVTNPQCPTMTNRSVGDEALRVTKKLAQTHIGPLHKNGIPVIAKVNISICFTSDTNHSANKEEINSKAAIVVIAYAAVR